MSSVNININARDNISPLLSKIQSQISTIQKNANNIRISGSGGIGGGASLFGSFTAAGLATQAITKSLTFFVDQAQDAVDKFIQLEKTSRQFAFAMSKNQQSLASFGGEIERLKITDFAKEFGFDVRTLTADFAKFAAATKGTNISISDSETIFKGTTKAAAALGIETGQVSRLYKAWTDIISKEKFAGQELLQLANSLPGSTNIMAKALNMSTSEFKKLATQGKLTSESIVTITKYMDEMFDVSAKGNFYSVQGQLNDLTNKFDEVKLKFAEGLGPALMVAISALGVIVERVGSFFESIFGRSIKSEVTKDLAENFDKTPEGKRLKELEIKQGDSPEVVRKKQKDILDFAKKSEAETKRKMDLFFKSKRPGGDLFELLTLEGGENQRAGYKGDSEEQELNAKYDKRNELMKYASPLTKDLIKQFKENKGDVTKEQIEQSFVKDLASVGLTEDSFGKLIIENIGNALLVGTGRKISEISGKSAKKGSLPKEGQLKDLVTQISKNEMIQKSAADAQSAQSADGGGGGAKLEEDKLKTDYHTPKILNINILTGDGASMVSGGINTDINTLEANTTDIRQNIKDILLGQLNDVVNDTATSLARVSKASGAF
jgi:tape measure domain-containing protein